MRANNFPANSAGPLDGRARLVASRSGGGSQGRFRATLSQPRGFDGRLPGSVQGRSRIQILGQVLEVSGLET